MDCISFLYSVWTSRYEHSRVEAQSPTFKQQATIDRFINGDDATNPHEPDRSWSSSPASSEVITWRSVLPGNDRITVLLPTPVHVCSLMWGRPERHPHHLKIHLSRILQHSLKVILLLSPSQAHLRLNHATPILCVNHIHLQQTLLSRQLRTCQLNSTIFLWWILIQVTLLVQATGGTL